MLKHLIEKFSKYQLIIIKLAILLALGFVYYAITQITHFYIPCPIKSLTGFACPGCGITHFFIDIINFRFLDAFWQNVAVAVLLPIWLLFGVIYAVFRPRLLKKDGLIFNILVWGSVVLLLLFGILRNIPQFSFLLPLYLR